MMLKKTFKSLVKIIKFLNQKGIGSLTKVFLSSLLVIFSFYLMPMDN